MDYSEYYTEINNIAAELVSEAMEQTENDCDAAEELINDSLLHETIDGHQWIIYYSYNDEIISHSSNDEYYRDMYGNEDIGRIVADQGLDHLKTIIAYWAMYADVQEVLENAFDEYETELETA